MLMDVSFDSCPDFYRLILLQSLFITPLLITDEAITRGITVENLGDNIILKNRCCLFAWNDKISGDYCAITRMTQIKKKITIQVCVIRG